MAMRFLIILLFATSAISAQQTLADKSMVFSLGSGGVFPDGTHTSIHDSEGGLTFYLSSKFVSDKTIESPAGTNHRIRYVGIRFLNHAETVRESIWLNHQDIGLLFGRSFGKTLIINFSGGVGLLVLTEDVAHYPPPGTFGLPEWTYEKKYLPGIPVEMEIKVGSPSGFGLGLTIYSNINQERTMTGIGLKLDFAVWRSAGR